MCKSHRRGNDEKLELLSAQFNKIAKTWFVFQQEVLKRDPVDPELELVATLVSNKKV